MAPKLVAPAESCSAVLGVLEKKDRDPSVITVKGLKDLTYQRSGVEIFDHQMAGTIMQETIWTYEATNHCLRLID